MSETCLQVNLPEFCWSELHYIVEFVLAESLGLNFRTDISATDELSILVGGYELKVDTSFFGVAHKNWLLPASLPQLPLKIWDTADSPIDMALKDPLLPVIYGRSFEPGKYVCLYENRNELGLDIFGSAFFMLSRYEEFVVKERDQFDRFPASSSVCSDFIMRPLVDEYIEVLWSCLKFLGPELNRRQRTPRMLLSCDVDYPYDYSLRSPVRFVRRVGSQVLKRKSPRAVARTFGNAVRCLRDRERNDPHYTFDYMMTRAESANLQMTFFFICGHSGGRMDGDYDIVDPEIRRLMQRIYDRGHLLGLHGSFHTYCDPELMTMEFQHLRRICATEKIKQNQWGARQHVLRWRTPDTFRVLNVAGLDYDSSLGYAEQVGFRCGICREFPVYDVQQRVALLLRERPLIAMEVSLLSDRYMGVSDPEIACEHLVRLKRLCFSYGGDFTLLWHNSNLPTDFERGIFERALLC